MWKSFLLYFFFEVTKFGLYREYIEIIYSFWILVSFVGILVSDNGACNILGDVIMQMRYVLLSSDWSS